jgi:hypothetical protein
MEETEHTSSLSANDKAYTSLNKFKEAYANNLITVDGVEYVKSNDSDYYYKLSAVKKTYTYRTGKSKDSTKTTTHYQIGAGLRGYTLKYYDTGGYTGSWGPEGRLAMLHQKEIVLNAHDTENFLTAIEIVRSIATQLESNALRTA